MSLKTFLNIKCNAKDNNHVCYNTVGHYIHNKKTEVNLYMYIEYVLHKSNPHQILFITSITVQTNHS